MPRTARKDAADGAAVAAAAAKDGADGLPFRANPDGTVDVRSVQRAGRSVTGATGEIVTFDGEGFARVRMEDALHFKDVPGFSFEGKPERS